MPQLTILITPPWVLATGATSHLRPTWRTEWTSSHLAHHVKRAPTWVQWINIICDFILPFIFIFFTLISQSQILSMKNEIMSLSWEFKKMYINCFAFSGIHTQHTSLVAQRLKHPPAMWETWVRSLGWEDSLEKETATHTPVFLPGKSHGQRSLVGYSPRGSEESDTTERLHILNIL